MARQIQIRRGNAEENDGFTGAIGEVTMDTTNKTLRVHDGTTRGGNELVSKNKFNSNITNCITQIPQDIKLELSNGVLTLKSGSKIYVPNGTGIFNSVTITNDLTITDNNTRTLWLSTNPSGTAMRATTGGETGTPVDSTYKLYYDPTENKCYRAYGTGHDQCSFPFAVIKCVSGTGVVSVDYCFNGFGYIGSTIFALPGLKTLAPYGRNSDGSLHNLECNITSVQILNAESSWTWDGQLMARPNGTLGVYGLNTTYSDSDNFYKYNNTNAGLSLLANISFSSGVITKFYPNNTFHIIDYNDKQTISNLCMPNYSAGIEAQNATAASGSYTAPSNGQLMVHIIAGTGSTTFKINNTSVGTQKPTTSGGYSVDYSVFVERGDVINWTCANNVTMHAYFYPMKRI